MSSLAVSVFAVTATEMMPIGLVPDMAADLHVSDGSIGLSVTLYGIVAGLLAPFWTSWTRRIDRRTLILAIVATFAVGNAATALVTTYAQFMLIRLAIGVVHGLMWSIIAGAAVRMVPARSSGRATSLAFSGISLALVLGVPAGSSIGYWLGWRAAFAVVAVIAGVAWVAVVIAVPRLPSQSTMRIADVPALIRRRGILGVLAATTLIVIANYSAYTYISPFLINRVGVDETSIGPYLLVYGVAGVIGNFAAGAIVARTHDDHGPQRALAIGIGAATLAIAIALTPVGPAIVVGLIALWGLTYSALPVMLQTMVFDLAPHAKDAATSLYVAVFNLSIAAGAGVGAVGINTSGTAAPLIIGATLGSTALIAALHIPGRPGLPPPVSNRSDGGS